MISKVEGLFNSSARKAVAVFAVPALLLTATMAQADDMEVRSAPVGISVGIGGGLAPSHRPCGGANPSGCDRLSFGHKVYVGYDITNDVTAQVSYLYFNGVNRDWDNSQNATNSRERITSRAWAFGFDWHIDLLHTVTNHLRVGVGRMETRQHNYLRAGGDNETSSFKVAPFVGAGLSIPLNEYFSMDASFDYFFAGSQSRHLLYIGATASY